MKQLRIMGLALLAILALGAVVVASASAAEGFLPEAEKTGTIHGGEATLENTNKESIICLLVEGKIVFNPASHGTGTLDFYDCKAGGFFAHSLGDLGEDEGTGGLILAKVLVLVCLIPGSSLLFAAAIEPSETVHIEVPIVGLLIEVKGLVIGHVLPGGNKKAKKFEVDFTGAKGVPAIKECVDSAGNKKLDTYESNTNHTKFIHASQKITAGTGELTFAVETELMD